MDYQPGSGLLLLERVLVRLDRIEQLLCAERRDTAAIVLQLEEIAVEPDSTKIVERIGALAKKLGTIAPEQPLPTP